MKRGSPDFVIFSVTLIILTIGIIAVFSSSSVTAHMDYGDSFYYLKRQLVWAALGVGAMIFAMNFHYKHLRKLANIGLIVSFIILFLVVLMGAGTATHGASRWLGIGPIFFQPSEFVKLALVIFMAKSLVDHREALHSFFKGVLPHLAVIGAVCVLILLQPDLGTAVTIAGTMFLMLVLAGTSVSHLSLLVVMGIGSVGAAVAAAPYRMERFVSFINPWADPSDTGFQVIQSLLALGSGGLLGMGLGQSRQKFFYLPERHTDFIYAILGEELGFMGASLVLFLFLILLWRGFKVALTVKDRFASLLAAGITCMIILQVVINIAVVTGSIPVTGITLPLISYGGSSLVFTLIGIGIILNISRYANK